MKERNHTIDVMRGFAILLVVITHYGWTDEERLIPVFPYLIRMAIPIFMILSGWTHALSFEKKQIRSFDDAYKVRNWLPAVIRYTLLFLIVILWFVLDPHISFPKDDVLETIRWVIDGTNGKGGYYYPILIQLVFYFPLIYFLIDRKKEKGLWIALIINAAYEFLKWAYGMNADCHRLLIFRYTFLIAVGVFIFKGGRLKPIKGTILTATGFLFITMTTYWGYEPKILTFWTSTCFLAAMWIVYGMVLLLQHVKIRFLPLEVMGRASYHIFLVQMGYYLGYYKLIGEQIPNRIGHMAVGVLISITVGILFYYATEPLLRLISRRIAGRSSR